MVSLTTLPDEILGIIMDNLNQKQKLALILLNKRMYNITILSLYKSIYVSFNPYLRIDREVSTSFDRKYTIVYDDNMMSHLLLHIPELFRNTRLVMYPTGNNIYGGSAELLKRKFRWIRLGIESSVGLVKFSDVDIIEDFWFPTFIEVPGDANYSITKLTFDLAKRISSLWLSERNDWDWNETHKYKFINFPCLKAVTIRNITQDKLTSFLVNFNHRFDVKRLSLEILTTDKLQLEKLFEIFNLNNISILDLEIKKEVWNSSVVSDFEKLFNNLPNLKIINTIYRSHMMDSILNFVNPDILVTFVIGN